MAKIKKGFFKSITDITVEKIETLDGGDFEFIPKNWIEYQKKLFSYDFDKFPLVDRVWKNNKYIVMSITKQIEFYGWSGNIDHLMIKKIQGGRISPHWQTLQKIKNKISGENRLAIEIYPKESQLVDEVNLYHLWVFPEDFELPFGLHHDNWFSKND